jgi:hypothetical protein
MADSVSLVAYCCETWSLSLMEENRPRLRVSENRMLRTLASTRQDITEVHSEKLHNFIGK